MLFWGLVFVVWSKMRIRRGEGEGEEEEKGMLWKALPVVRSKQIGGKLGPAFGLGAGCGFGIGIGLLGGAGFGPGIPGLQFGFGFGVGCGVGFGFGYGLGRGIAQDDTRRYSNVVSHQNDEIAALLHNLLLNTKKLLRATSTEIHKRRPSK